MTALKISACILIGYLFGNFNTAYIIGKLRGYDVRNVGSGNAGASNTVIMAGKALGFLTALVDILKTAAACWIAEALLPDLRYAFAIGGAACAVGHMYPVFLAFRGGKGLACLGGICLAYDPMTLLILLLVAIVIGIVSQYVFIASVSMAAVVPVYLGIGMRSWETALILAVPGVLMFIRHIENYKRMQQGKEMKLSFLWNKKRELDRLAVDPELHGRIKQDQ